MGVCNFQIPFTDDAGVLIGKARSAVESQGGFFQGDNLAGDFSITLLGNTVKGSYSVSGNMMNIRVDEKPVFVPCSTIENYLKSKTNK